MRQFFTIISVGLIAITLASKAEDWRLDRQESKLFMFKPYEEIDCVKGCPEHEIAEVK